MDEPLIGRKETLYEALADELVRLVQAGTLRPGDRLPSVRRMSQQKNLSLTTVLQAYQLLEDQGVIEARPQSGYYVRPAVAQATPAPEVPASLPDPEHVQVDELVMRVVRDAMRPGLVQFGAALPAPELLPTARINRILARIARDNIVAAQAVGLPEGMLELRTQVARRTLESGCALEPDDFVITCGCAEAIHLALQATCRPGDLVAVEVAHLFRHSAGAGGAGAARAGNSHPRARRDEPGCAQLCAGEPPHPGGGRHHQFQQPAGLLHARGEQARPGRAAGALPGAADRG